VKRGTKKNMSRGRPAKLSAKEKDPLRKKVLDKGQ